MKTIMEMVSYLGEEEEDYEKHHHAGADKDNIEPVANIFKCWRSHSGPKNWTEKEALHSKSDTLSPELIGEYFRSVNKWGSFNANGVARWKRSVYPLNQVLKHVHNNDRKDEENSCSVSSAICSSV